MKSIIVTVFLILLALLSCSVYASVQEASTSPLYTVCGNNIKETGEQCDGADWGGHTCVTLGFVSGTLTCYANCTFNTSACSSGNGGGGGGGGGGGALIPPVIVTKVVLQGKAYPSAEMTILKDGQVAKIITADSRANFKAELIGLTAGTYTFGVWGEDKDGRRSITFSFTINVASGTITTLSGIFLPPTIELEKTKLKKGEFLNILGQTVPQSEINVHVESPEKIIKKTTADTGGDWNYPFDTGILDEGSHTTRAKAVSPGGLLSTYSNTLIFVVGKGIIVPIKRGDINTDKRVNLVDFSILLYNWGVPKSPAADLNSDGKVNLVDFSIMLYWWTG